VATYAPALDALTEGLGEHAWVAELDFRPGIADRKIERVTLSKQRLHMRRNDRALIEVRVEPSKRNGRALYDLSGKAVDIDKP
jgi:hypothetical protein